MRALQPFWVTCVAQQIVISFSGSSSTKKKHVPTWVHWLKILKSSAVFWSIFYLFSAGLLTCCQGTDPVPPSLLWPAAVKQPARPTCTAVSTLCSTPNPPTTSGQRTSTCAWALPWKLVSADNFPIFVRSVEAWNMELISFSLHFRQTPQVLQVWGCRSRCHRLAPRFRLHQHDENCAGALSNIWGH